MVFWNLFRLGVCYVFWVYVGCCVVAGSFVCVLLVVLGSFVLSCVGGCVLVGFFFLLCCLGGFWFGGGLRLFGGWFVLVLIFLLVLSWVVFTCGWCALMWLFRGVVVCLLWHCCV